MKTLDDVIAATDRTVIRECIAIRDALGGAIYYPFKFTDGLLSLTEAERAVVAKLAARAVMSRAELDAAIAAEGR